VTINLETLASARWYAGKGREATRLETADVVTPPGAEGAVVELVDVSYADGAIERYAVPTRGGAECGPRDPLWVALAREAGVDAREADRFAAEDISNTVVLLDGNVLLKLYRRLEGGVGPEAELLAALDGFHAPRLLGSLESHGATLVVVQEYVAGEQVGWEGLIAALAVGDERAGEPAELAATAAALHRALAERLGVFEDPAQAVPLQRVHGDLNVAQFLRTAERLVVVDWEGEPGLALAARVLPRPALRDLATLRLSLAHAARAAHRRNEAFDWRGWAAAARHEALAAYSVTMGAVEVELLHALEVEKEHTELAYARQWLPEWEYVPRDVLPFILEEAG
jgi:maltokinase